MTTAAKKQQLMIYLADAETKKVNELYSLLKDDMKESAFTLTKAHLDILEERRNDYKSGKSSMVPWDESMQRIRKNRKNA